jgi:pyruvate ferredoxin oxidoreductase alpha subunit
MKTLLDGNKAAAWGARLARAKVVPNFPITPQTEIIETLAKWKAEGEWDGEFVPLDSEHSVLSAAIASEACGARTFTASSSQGLLLMHEMHYVASGMRLPLVMVNCSRGLAAPITLWSDLNDILALRDSGWLMFFAKNNQEVLDLIIQAYAIGENKEVLLPSIINMEGFILSYTREPTEIPEQEKIDEFLPPYKPQTVIDINNSMSLGVPVLHEYMYFKSQQHKAQLNALKVAKKVFEKFEKIFGRKYSLIECYCMEDAKVCFVSMGCLSSVIECAVDELRKEGIKAGLLRILCYRPFPGEEIRRVLEGCEKVIVIDNNISPGSGGILYPEIKAVHDGKTYDFIVSLGGKHISKKDFVEICKKALTSEKEKFWLL